VVVADSTYDTPFISVLAPGGAEAAAALADPHLVAATQAPGVTVIDASLESLDPCVHIKLRVVARSLGMSFFNVISCSSSCGVGVLAPSTLARFVRALRKHVHWLEPCA
jgi:hypothetical protein